MTRTKPPMTAAQTDQARRLLLLVMLDGRVELVGQKAREGLGGDCPTGATFTGYVPNPDDPDDPFVAGTVRADPGPVTVRVDDEATFHAWVAKHYPTKLTRQPAGTTARQPVAGELLALQAVYDAARAASPWGDPGADLWRVLQGAGYQLVPIEPTLARTVVEQEFWDGLEKAVKTHAKGAPAGDLEVVDQMGLPVEGVTATKGAPRVVVTPSKDKRIVDAFAAAHRDELVSVALPALEGAT